MPKLFMLLVGCTPEGRNIEQHDIFFGIADAIDDLIPDLIGFWPEAKGKLHIDAWREVSRVDDHAVKVVSSLEKKSGNSASLFFINLGGYKKNEFEEFHYKMILAADNKGEAITRSKKTSFFKHTGFSGADSHIDDKYGIDVDDIFEIEEILPDEAKKNFRILVSADGHQFPEDELHLGYFKLSSFKKTLR